MNSSLSGLALSIMTSLAAVWLPFSDFSASTPEREIEGHEADRRSDYNIIQSHDVRAPRGPAGDWPDSGCFTWAFQIDKDGIPYNIRAENNSRNYGLHVAMRSGLRSFRFKATHGADPDEIYQIGFQYERGNSAAKPVVRCNYA